MATHRAWFERLSSTVLGSERAVTSPIVREHAFHGDPRAFSVGMREIIQKVHGDTYRVTDEDVAGARSEGHSDDAIFELVVCAAVGAAFRRRNQALDTINRLGE